MDTNAHARTQVARVIASGIDATTVARRLGVSPRWLRRWLSGHGAIRLDAYDELTAYLAELGAARRARFRLVSSRW